MGLLDMQELRGKLQRVRMKAHLLLVIIIFHVRQSNKTTPLNKQWRSGFNNNYESLMVSVAQLEEAFKVCAD